MYLCVDLGDMKKRMQMMGMGKAQVHVKLPQEKVDGALGHVIVCTTSQGLFT